MRYFCGKDIHGVVIPATANTFKDLVDRYVNIAVQLNVTRQQYAAMTPKEKDTAKQTHYLTPAAFSAARVRRKTENATSCNLIFLDIDPAKDGKSSPATPLLSNLDLLAQSMQPFSFCVYHTASSTPELPRIRVMVDAEAIPLDKYPEAVKTVAKLIGLPAVNTESTVPVQAMYMPCLFADTNPEEDHPLVIAEVGGRPFTAADIGEVDAIDTMGRGKVMRAIDGSIDVLDFLRSPVEGITLKEASDMLDCLSPDMDYREWLEVAVALKHQFRDCEKEAYELWDAWSAKGNKYDSAEETAAKWDSFRAQPLNRVPVTIRSLMHRATLAGWDNGKVKEDQFSAVVKWINQAPNVNALLSEGLNRIATTPLLTRAEEEMLLHNIVKSAARYQCHVSVTALRKDLATIRERLRVKENDGKDTVPPWVRGCVFVTAANQFFRQRTRERFTLEAWDNKYSRFLLPTEKMLEQQGVTPNMVNMSKPLVFPRQYALNVVQVPTVWDYSYHPGQPDELIVVDGGKTYVNTYRRCHPTPIPSEAAEAGALFMGHMDVLIAEESYRRTMMDWLAYMVQYPGEKIRWAVLLQGAEGCGKSFLSDVMRVVLGNEHVHVIGGKALFDGWNEWAEGHQLVTLEEVRVQGVNRHEVMNVLKPLITNDVVPVSQRFRDSREVPNRTNYLLLTNFDDALAVTNESRRYFVVQSKIQHKAEVQVLNKSGHFQKLYDMLAQQPGGIRSFFESYQISDNFAPDASAPETTYLKSLVENSAGELTSAIRRLLVEGDHPLVQADIVSSKALEDILRTTEHARFVNHNAIGAVLRGEGYEQLGRYHMDDGRHYLWVHRRVKGLHSRPAPELARQRVLDGTTNLNMHILL